MTSDRVALLGWPVAHSVSPHMHNAAFRSLSLTSWSYELLPVEPLSLSARFPQLKREGFVGLNVTIPFKEALLPWLTLDETARAVGAVNTVCLRSGRGYNTDAGGLVADLQEQGVELRGKRVLLLGAGGAARAAAWGLFREGARLGGWARSWDAVRRLQDTLDVPMEPVRWEQVSQWQPAVIVHCTPVGMWPHTDASLWPKEIPFPPECTLVDLVYRPARTRLMQQAEAAGCRVLGGLGMLVHQGALAFSIWTGAEAPLQVMKEAAQNALRETT